VGVEARKPCDLGAGGLAIERVRDVHEGDASREVWGGICRGGEGSTFDENNHGSVMIVMRRGRGESESENENENERERERVRKVGGTENCEAKQGRCGGEERAKE
jgi:hypothetical protein